MHRWFQPHKVNQTPLFLLVKNTTRLVLLLSLDDSVLHLTQFLISLVLLSLLPSDQCCRTDGHEQEECHVEAWMFVCAWQCMHACVLMSACDWLPSRVQFARDTFSEGPRLRKMKPPRIECIERIDTGMYMYSQAHQRMCMSDCLLSVCLSEQRQTWTDSQRRTPAQIRIKTRNQVTHTLKEEKYMSAKKKTQTCTHCFPHF